MCLSDEPYSEKKLCVCVCVLDKRLSQKTHQTNNIKSKISSTLKQSQPTVSLVQLYSDKRKLCEHVFNAVMETEQML